VGQAFDDQRAEQALVAALLQRATLAGTTSAPPGTLVKIAGTAQPGPAGVLRAPASGAPCVWYRTLRVPLDGPPGHAGAVSIPPTLSSTTPLLRGGMSGGSEDVSGAPFAVSDAAGQLLCDPRGGHVDSSVQSLNTRQPESWSAMDGGALVVEWIIAAGAPVFVVGEMARGADGSANLVAPAGGRVVVGTDGEAALAGKAQAFAARAPLAPVGGGRLALAIGIAVGAVLLVVLVVVLIVLA
jgi:hypothetical protein